MGRCVGGYDCNIVSKLNFPLYISYSDRNFYCEDSIISIHPPKTGISSSVNTSICIERLLYISVVPAIIVATVVGVDVGTKGIDGCSVVSDEIKRWTFVLIITAIVLFYSALTSLRGRPAHTSDYITVDEN